MTNAPVLQLGRSAIARRPGDDLQRLRVAFDRDHCIQLPGFFDPDLLALVRRLLDRAEFVPFSHTDLAGVELCLRQEAPAFALLHLVVNDPGLLAIVRALTGCSEIAGFAGRVYRMVPGAGHYDQWHSDAVEGRLIGLSVNLSPKGYCGGLFQLRQSGSGRLDYEAANTGFGDAILFRIDPRLEHHITPVEGTVPKTAFAGWFKAGPSLLSLLKSIAADGAGLASPNHGARSILNSS